MLLFWRASPTASRQNRKGDFGERIGIVLGGTIGKGGIVQPVGDAANL
jgi:hypothetical protein